MPSVNPKHANFHQVVNDAVAAVFMTDLVKGHEEIHVFVKHPVDEPFELPVEDFEPLDVRQPSKEPEGVDAQALEVVGDDQQNEDVVYCVSSDNESESDHYYGHAEYEDDNDNDDEHGHGTDEYRDDFS